MIDKQYAKDVTEQIIPVRYLKSITEFINAFDITEHTQDVMSGSINLWLFVSATWLRAKGCKNSRLTADKGKAYAKNFRKYDRQK